jgi:cyclin-dependent kinase 7
MGKFLGEGTWGSVYEASRRSDGLRVAIKRIKPGDPKLGMNFTALREIKYLRELRHTNVVDVS